MVVVVAGVAFMGIAAVQTNAAANAIETDGQARAAVEATELHVRVLDASVSTAPGDGSMVVDHLKIEIVIRSPQAYPIAVPPTLCAGGTGPAGGRYSIDAAFLVVDDSVPPPPSGTPAASEDCLGVSPGHPNPRSLCRPRSTCR